MAARHACLGVVPVGFTLYICWIAVAHHAFAVDFHNAFWPAGRNVLDGHSPYVSTSSPLVGDGVAFVYPAPGALLFAAFSWMPHTAADVLFTLICVAAAAGTLWILGVRDWRLYGLTFLWPPVISGWQTANLSLLIAFGVAMAWRFRDRPLVAGLVIGLIASLKVFVWPLGLWLLATRRFAALAWALGSAIIVNLVAWAVLGFDQLNAYTALVHAVTKVEQGTAYTPIALALRLGSSLSVAQIVGFGLAGLAAAYCLYLGWRQREESSLLLAIAVSLLATPIVWRHYFVLFLVPLAVARPRFSVVWLVPLVLFPCPVTTPSLWQLLLTLAAMVFIVAVLLRWPRQAVRDMGVANSTLQLAPRLAAQALSGASEKPAGRWSVPDLLP